jgi:hypothetical protein
MHFVEMKQWEHATKNYQQSIEHQIHGMNWNGKRSITWAAALKTQFFDRSSRRNFVTHNGLLFPMEPSSWNAKPTECRALIHLKSTGQQQLLSPFFTFCSQIPPSFNQHLLWELFAASSLSGNRDLLSCWMPTTAWEELFSLFTLQFAEQQNVASWCCKLQHLP